MQPVTELRLVVYTFHRLQPGTFQLKRIMSHAIGIEREECTPLRDYCRMAAIGILAASGNNGADVDKIFADADSFLAVDGSGKPLDLALTPDQAGLSLGVTIHVILNEFGFPREVAIPLLVKEVKELHVTLEASDKFEGRGPPLTFVSYARPDFDGAKAIVDLLSDSGLCTWFDKKDLKAGQEWEYEIRKQIGAASLVLICLSRNAADRKGFFHKEMRYAVEEALQLPKGKVFIMPVCFDECPIPDDLRKWHALRLFEPGASQQLLCSIGDALECGVRARSEAHAAFERAMRKYTAT